MKKPGGITGRGFMRGQSGNPSGRPKVDAEVRALAQQHCQAAIERLVVLMKSKNQTIAVRACEALLDRGIGRPAQTIQHQGDDGGPLTFRLLSGTKRSTPDA